ncbi:MAG: hypothetical protein DRP75_00065 [Candidatus Omnitrophota bacterium]|nr:MAG: hypothetical protein DRP75_00065 [Candidatus Omnitrophota bacterium]
MSRERKVKEIIVYLLMLSFFLTYNLAFYSKAKDKKTAPLSRSFQEEVWRERFNKKMIEDESVRQKALILSSLFLLFLLLGSISLINFCRLNLGRRKPIERFGERKTVGWEVGDVLKVIVLVLFSVSLIRLLFFFVFTVLALTLSPSVRMILSSLIIDTLLIFFVIYFVLKKYRQNLTSLGIEAGNLLRKIKLGISAYITITPVLFILLLILNIWIERFDYHPPLHPLMSLIFKEERGVVLLFLLLLGTVMGPIAEEIFFRGFAYPAIKKRVGVYPSIFFTSFFFALLHQSLFAFLPVLFLGIVLAYIYEKSNSLIPCITLHILHNSLMIAGVLFIKEVSNEYASICFSFGHLCFSS